jgi:hypothetical protein
MSETTEAILEHLKGKSPDEIARTLQNLQDMSTEHAKEKGVISARQQAADEKMSLAETTKLLEKANAECDLKTIERLLPLHKEKINWVAQQMQSDQAEELRIINEPAVASRKERAAEVLGEMNMLISKAGKSHKEWRKLDSLQAELKGLT